MQDREPRPLCWVSGAAQVSFVTLIKGVREPLPAGAVWDIKRGSPSFLPKAELASLRLNTSSQPSLTPLQEHPCEYSTWLAMFAAACLSPVEVVPTLGLLAIVVSRVSFRRVSGFWEARVFVCVVFPFQGFLCTGCTVNAESTAACVCSAGVGERALYMLTNTQLDLLLSSGSRSLCRAIFSVLGWESCDCQKAVLIGTSDLKIVL